ncbi:hypothetical protein OAL09_09410 [Verrucomicrobia bacterium]|nr:hypothetical protein [Verrucomicrobiota bacterium]
MFLNYNQSQNPPKIITGTVAGDSWITPHDPRTTDRESWVIGQGAGLFTKVFTNP